MRGERTAGLCGCVAGMAAVAQGAKLVRTVAHRCHWCVPCRAARTCRPPDTLATTTVTLRLRLEALPCCRRKSDMIATHMNDMLSTQHLA